MGHPDEAIEAAPMAGTFATSRTYSIGRRADPARNVIIFEFHVLSAHTGRQHF